MLYIIQDGDLDKRDAKIKLIAFVFRKCEKIYIIVYLKNILVLKMTENLDQA